MLHSERVKTCKLHSERVKTCKLYTKREKPEILHSKRVKSSTVETLKTRTNFSGKIHTAGWRPLDFVGFPVLEDERSFGAFRGN